MANGLPVSNQQTSKHCKEQTHPKNDPVIDLSNLCSQAEKLTVKHKTDRTQEDILLYKEASDVTSGHTEQVE